MADPAAGNTRRELRTRLRARFASDADAAHELGGSFRALRVCAQLAEALGSRAAGELGRRERDELGAALGLEAAELEAAGRLLASVDWPRAATARRRRDEQVDHGPRHPVNLRDRQGVLPARVARRLVTSADNDRRGPLEGSDPIGPYRSSWTPRADLLRLLSTLGALYYTEGRGEDGTIYFTLNQAGGVAWEREIGWSDYRAVEDHLLEAHEGEIEATCNTSREGYANRERSCS
jgi:hypothetical protein